ncbi:MAG TPA: VWA domain-containing protein [Vicinamibacterales bacterium]
MNIGFLSPLFLLGLLTIAIPIVLHLFRRRVDPIVPFAATRFLRRAPVEQARQRRLQDRLLLALRIAALVLLAIGFSRPYFAAPVDASAAGLTVVMVDVSASMGDGRRFAQALERAGEAIDGAPSGHEVAVIAFAARPDVVVAPTTDRGAARAALGRLQPTAAATRYRAALARAADLARTRPARLVMVTDLQESGWSEGPHVALRGDIAFEVVDVGPMPVNAGITAATRIGNELAVRVQGTGPARELQVALTIDGQPAGQRPVRLPADGSAEVRLPLRADRGRARVAFTTVDGVPADDERWVVLDPRPRPRVVVVTAPGSGQSEGIYVRRALEAAEEPRAWDVVVVTADRLRGDEPLAGASLVVLVGTAGMDRRGAEAIAALVERGGGLLVTVGPSVNVDLIASAFGERFPRVRVGTAGDEQGMTPVDLRHPIFRLFEPDGGAFNTARFTRVATIALAAPGSVLARFDSGAPALVEQRHGGGRLGVFASDLSNRWNDLVLQPVFVPFVNEAAWWLAGNLAPPAELVAGETAWPGADRPGVVEWTPPADGNRRAGMAALPLAVNVDPRELDPDRIGVEEFAARIERSDAEERDALVAHARRQEAEQGWWRYGLGLMLIGLVVESLIGRRG